MSCFFRLLILIFVFAVTAFTAAAQNQKTMPVVVELFTSEGCSTCPPADKYLQTLVQEQPNAGMEIIGLSEHVDYWNQFGWIDPFSSAQFSNRQKYYAMFFKRTNIFTPQFVVDGTHEITSKDGAKSLIEYAKELKGEINLSVRETKENEISFDVKVTALPKISDGDKAVVVIAITENNLVSEVSSGENSGHKLKHTAVTRYLKTIGEINGEAANLAADVVLGKDWKRDDLSVVVFVQEVVSRRILGAAKINFKDKFNSARN